ncbi:hypothetical protein [Chryseolinea lacunae]|uniref:Uncharacterized protein n=1 Tax=Chryseolinea lacunae TaxID=2801331 RepID=A0ABS1KRZ4_9BACT|nr:hypothetical protein [Chryseolinea lacunae]MBL0742022.1 hypothetical protein [Chryseolinea lacunae]
MRRPVVRTYRLLDSKIVFVISLLVIVLTILGVYLLGLGSHHTFFENSFLSTTILSTVFCAFITAGLYYGVKLKDNVGRVTDVLKKIPPAPDTSNFSVPDVDINLDVDDEAGIGLIVGIVISILLWLLVAGLLAVVLWAFGSMLFITFATFVAMLYWIFFRALRLVFKNSKHTKGDLPMSVIYAVFYTFLYNFWIYGIFFLTAYLKSR